MTHIVTHKAIIGAGVGYIVEPLKTKAGGCLPIFPAAGGARIPVGTGNAEPVHARTAVIGRRVLKIESGIEESYFWAVTASEGVSHQAIALVTFSLALGDADSAPYILAELASDSAAGCLDRLVVLIEVSFEWAAAVSLHSCRI